MITATSWTFEYVNGLEWNDVKELDEYWKEFPPTHLILAAVYLPEKKSNKDWHPDGTVHTLNGQKVKDVTGAVIEQAQRANPAIPFDRLPAHVQKAIMGDKEFPKQE